MREKQVEKMLVTVVAVLLLVLNVLMVMKYDAVFSVVAADYAKRLSYLFHVSGFDPNNYAILTEWGMRYDVLRHPLLPYLMALPASVNEVVMSLFGFNAALYISAMIVWFSLPCVLRSNAAVPAVSDKHRFAPPACRLQPSMPMERPPPKGSNATGRSDAHGLSIRLQTP